MSQLVIDEADVNNVMAADDDDYVIEDADDGSFVPSLTPSKTPPGGTGPAASPGIRHSTDAFMARESQKKDFGKDL